MLNEGMNPEINETEERKITEVWILDDRTDVRNRLNTIFRALSRDTFGVLSFETAKDALAKINELIETNQSLPTFILVDGELEKDEPALAKGENFIYQVRQLEIPQPILVAHSSGKENNDRMLACGADLAMEKSSDIMPRAYLKILEQIKAKLAQAEVSQN